HERDLLGVRSVLDQTREPLDQRGGLPGAGAARDEERAAAMLQDSALAGIGVDGRRAEGSHVADASARVRQSEKAQVRASLGANESTGRRAGAALDGP